MSDPQHVHFVGIGGIHMSGLAEILLGDGVTVSGSDLTPSPLIERLRARGARIALEHQAGHVEGADLVVHTLAAQATNPELVAARQAGIPLITRAEMVARVAEGLTAVTVAGSHGKTTTAAMLTVILREAGLDPTYVLGGECSNLPAHAARGHGDLAVLEADEYGRAFHAYRPRVALITNVESDHLDYYGTAAALQEAFLDYATTLQPQGTLIVGAESPCAAAVAGRAQERRPDLVVRSFGLGPAFDWAAVAVQQDERRSEFLLRHKGEEPTPVPLGVPGEHNVRNALAATAAAAAVGVDLATAGQALAEFSGVRRPLPAARRNGRRGGAGRLRPPPDGDRGDAGDSAHTLPRAAPGGAVSAPYPTAAPATCLRASSAASAGWLDSTSPAPTPRGRSRRPGSPRRAWPHGSRSRPRSTRGRWTRRPRQSARRCSPGIC